MGWESNEVWLDTEVLWFRERPRPAAAALGLALPTFGAYVPEPYVPRRRPTAAERKAAERRKFATRTVPAVALVIGSATMLPLSFFRDGERAAAGPLREDPPSQTFRLDRLGLEVPAPPLTGLGKGARTDAGSSRATAETASGPPAIEEPTFQPIEWRHATSSGLWFSGSLADGTQLPTEGADWVTWNPATDSSPNLPHRLYGNERTIRAIVSAIAGYRRAHPEAPRVVVGDISFRDGGRMDEHVSHQNGLDVDVYYPRLDRSLRAPTTPDQIDRALAQDLLDRFVAAGARMIFVGYSTGLRGPSGVVVPYPNHENHLHVRFPTPA
jgi:Penicillin-insensitive murein endopeptidase